MLASRPSIFKSAVSMLLSLTQSPGKLTGDFFWTRSRKAEWSCVISTALWFFLRTHQFVKVDGNLGTFPTQAFDSLLPFGTQYILHFLKEQKNQGLLAGFFFAALSLCSAQAEGSAFTGAVAGGWLTLEEWAILWQRWPTRIQGFEHLGDSPPYCSSVIPLRPRP